MTDPGFPVFTGQEDLVIDGVSTNTAGWITDLSPLRGGPDVTGSNVKLPGVGGSHPYRRWPAETTYPLEIQITGAWDPVADAPHADPEMGLQLNIDYLIDNVCTYGEDATRPAVRVMRDASERTADVQVRLELAPVTEGGYDQAGVLFVTVTGPTGRFVPAAAPANNDNWADAIEIDVETDTVLTADNTGYTLEDDEQMPSVADVVRTAWWKFTAPATGTVDLDTNGTPFDTVLAAWTGATLIDLVEEDSDDDGGVLPNSALTLFVTEAVTYYVQVGAFTSADPSEGEITLNVSWTP